ncbi:MAG: SAM-dependent methyltransferase, partial [Actinobacteria bacterium]|nr:SAM-dependent methyltransferase [Actinomycetota bacterium]
MADIDPDKLKLFSFLLFSKLEGAVTSGMVHLGDQLGLYRALAATA